MPSEGRQTGRDAAPPDAGSSPSAVVREAMAAYERGDLDALLALVHSEAEIEMLILDGGVARGPEGLAEALAMAAKQVHRPKMSRVEEIGTDAALMIGRIQYGDAERGISDHEAVWLNVLRDGMIWRSKVFASAPEARAAYAELKAPQRPPRFRRAADG